MDGPESIESREAVERLREWLQQGSDLVREFVDRLPVLQEQGAAGEGEIAHWRRLAEAAREEGERRRREIEELRSESERLQQELVELRAENEQLRKQQEGWDAMVGSVDETTRRVNDMIAKLRASRGTNL